MSVPDLNRRFTDRDIRDNSSLSEIAYNYVVSYTGEFEFLVDMQKFLRDGRTLNPSQVRSILNCMRSDPRASVSLQEGMLQSSLEKEIGVATVSPLLKPGYQHPCRRTDPHSEHRYADAESHARRTSHLCVGIPWAINRARTVDTHVWVKPKYTRSKTSGILHKVASQRIDTPVLSTDKYYTAQGYIEWSNIHVQHGVGYGVPNLYVRVECGLRVLRNPALHWNLPDFEQMSQLLGIESRTCKRCFSSES